MVNLPNIIKKLKSQGIDLSTPAAVITEGTTPYQKVVTGTVKDIVAKIRREKLKPPAIIVIGKVVTLRNKLNWIKNKNLPLENKNILIASPKESFYKLKSPLEEAGARAHHAEVTKITHLKNNPRFDRAIKNIAQYNWLIFTSRNAVRAFIKKITALKLDLRLLGNLKIAAIGPGTKDELKNYMITADLIPKNFSSQGLIESFARMPLKNKKILLLRGDKATGKLPLALKAKGARTLDIRTYKLTHNRIPAGRIKKVLNQKIDMIVFTSSENTRSFFTLVKKFNLEKIIKNIKIAGMGKPTGDTLKKYGYNCITPKDFTFDGIVKMITGFYKNG